MIFVATLLFWMQVSAHGEPLSSPDLYKIAGSDVPTVNLIDSDDRAVDWSKLKGKPLFINPVYTSCGSACPIIARTLNTALGSTGRLGQDFNVLTVTFDRSDEAEDLKNFKEESGLPKSWIVARLDAKETRNFFAALDFRYRQVGDGVFDHPNGVLLADKNLKIAKYISLSDINPVRLNESLIASQGLGRVWFQMQPYVFITSVLGFLCSLVFVLIRWGRRPLRVNG